LSRPDVLIVGGGVIGCAIARHLARRGAGVVAVERGRPGEEASWAAAGMLAPLVEAGGPGPLLELLLRSREMYPELAAALREETGIDVGYSDAGALSLALTGADERELSARYAWQTAEGLPVERLSAEETLALEPHLTPSLRWALRFPGDHQVENRDLARALWSAAAEAGVEFRLGVEVSAVLRSGGRVEGVELAGGERLEAGGVVVAAGSWAGRLGGLPRPLPVVPVRGQLVAVEVLPPRFRHCVDSPRVYAVPRADGRLIIGATVERAGFRKAVTPAGIRALLSAAVEVAPWVDQLPIVETWSGLRPGTPDDLPILGADPEVPNLFYATGHYRNGILLAPITGELIGDLVLGSASAAERVAPFGIGRFTPPPGPA
jgi:glycine oxidase